MAFRPNIVVQLSTRERVATFRSGLGDALGIVALGVDASTMWKMPGIDALYLTLSRAERWGSHPLPPHTAKVLQTTEADQEGGMPPFIITGLVLKDDEPNTASFGIPILMEAVFRAAVDLNATRPGAIRTIGFFETELMLFSTSLSEVGRLIAASLSRT